MSDPLRALTDPLEHGPILARLVWAALMLGVAWMLISIGSRGSR